jgi:hypothetical protein
MKNNFAALLMLIALVHFSQAKTPEKVIYSFPSGGGITAVGTLTLDEAGNLYGVVAGIGNGAVFELTPAKGGRWTETNIYNFTGGSDGSAPSGGVIFDAAGNLYGVATTGGNGCSGGCGTVYELTPGENGQWTVSVLYSFTGGTDGGYPAGTLVFDPGGSLYGGTETGGDLSCTVTGHNGCGAIFELSPGENGQWTEKVVHAFKAHSDGAEEVPSGLIFDGAGNLYGTTAMGGKGGVGTAFELKLTRGGKWTETVLHSFSSAPDADSPAGALVFSGSALYGTTAFGGSSTCYEGLGCGTVFQLTENGGAWSETIIHSFQGSDGIGPTAAVLPDQAGNLFVVTSGGGSDWGTVVELTPIGDGNWQESILHDFGSHAGDGRSPLSGLVFGPSGKLFGATPSGGKNGAGTVYESTP